MLLLYVGVIRSLNYVSLVIQLVKCSWSLRKSEILYVLVNKSMRIAWMMYVPWKMRNDLKLNMVMRIMVLHEHSHDGDSFG